MLEARTDPRIVGKLRDFGHRISLGRPWEEDWGPVSAIMITDKGLREAVADPRVETALALTD